MKTPKVQFIGEEQEVPNAISFSQMSSFMKCRKQWAYRYIDKLNPKKEAPPLQFGKVMHTALADTIGYYAFNPDCSPKTAAEVGFCVIEEYVDAARNTAINNLDSDSGLESSISDIHAEYDEKQQHMYAVLNRALSAFDLNKWVVYWDNEVPMIETHFDAAITPKKHLHGFIDLVAMEKSTGLLWQIDWKFRSTLSPDEDEAYNIQNAIYTRVLREYGVQVVGSITFQILSTPTTLPNINKNGTLSRAKIRCSWEDYSKACVEAGQEPADYEEEMRPKLEEIEWTRVTKEYQSREMSEILWRGVIKPASKEMLRKYPNSKLMPSIYPMNCKYCAYSPLCQAELRGFDMDFLKEEGYTQGTTTSAEIQEEGGNPDV